MIRDNIPQNNRLQKLNEFAQNQMQLLAENQNIRELEIIEKDVNRQKMITNK